MSEQQASRRQFLISSAGTLVAVGCGHGETNDPIGDPSYYPNSTRQTTPPMDTDMPMCASTTGLMPGPAAASLSVNQYIVVSGRIVVCRDSNGLFALDLTCTHAGCEPALVAVSDCWLCPCHGSTYFFNGTLAGIGPAPRPLPRYAVCEGSDGNLYIDMSKMI